MTKTISGYTTTYNCIEMHYPFEQAIESLLGFCDEVIVVDAGSQDGTLDTLRRLRKQFSKLKVYVEPIDFTHPRWAIHQDGFLKAKARAYCTGAYCWQSDSDEIVHPDDFWKIRQLPDLMGDTKLIMLPMIEFWGSLEVVRGDFFSWKPRFSLNDPAITHGIPNRHRCMDESGHAYPRPYDSDSCNYIYRQSGEDVQVVIPISRDLKQVAALSDPEFEKFYFECIEQYPSAYHVSWLNLPRKIAHYKKFWHRFHASMYNHALPDTAQNNVMFDKPWSAVSDEDIRQKSEELKILGPRSFHRKIDPSKRGLTLRFTHKIPESLRVWAAKEPVIKSTPPPTQILVSELPLVSFVIPSFNKANFLRESVGSAAAQDYLKLEVLIVNDGSTDNTSEVAKLLMRDFSHREITLLEKSNGGVSDARNFGISKARGEYIVTLDGDDIADRSFTSKGMQTLSQSKAQVFCSDVELFGAKNGEWSPPNYDSYLIRYTNSIPSLALFDKKLWQKSGGYKVALGFVEDWEFWISCSRYGMQAVKASEKLFRYRMIENGLAEAHINNRHRDCQSVVAVANEDLYPVEELLQAHTNLVEVPQATLEKVKRLDSIHPREWLLKFWLGLIAERQGRQEEALSLFCAAISLSAEKNWQPILRAGLVSHNLGRNHESAEFLHAVRAKRPDMARYVNDALKEIERKIVAGQAQSRT